MTSWQNLRQWYASLQTREQRILMAGGIALLLVLLYGGILAPYLHSRSTLAEHVAEQQALLAWMGPASARLQAQGHAQPAAMPPGNLLATLNREAAAAGLGTTLRQIQQQNDGSVQLQFESVPFDDAVRWLADLHQRYGINIESMSAQRSAGVGLVNLNLTLATSVP